MVVFLLLLELPDLQQSPPYARADLLTKDWSGGSNILGKSEVKLESKTPNGIVRAAPLPPGLHGVSPAPGRRAGS